MTKLILASINARLEARRIETNDWSSMELWTLEDSRLSLIAAKLQLRSWRGDPDFCAGQRPYVAQN